MSGDTASGGRSLSVAFLSPSWPAERAANGIVTYVERISEALRRSGHRTCILSAGSAGDDPGPDVYRLWDQKRAPSARLLDGIAFRLNPETAFRRRYAATWSRLPGERSASAESNCWRWKRHLDWRICSSRDWPFRLWCACTDRA